jgi:hypothetical protein
MKQIVALPELQVLRRDQQPPGFRDESAVRIKDERHAPAVARSGTSGEEFRQFLLEDRIDVFRLRRHAPAAREATHAQVHDVRAQALDHRRVELFAACACAAGRFDERAA